MAKKQKRAPAPGKKRYRRTDEELISDLRDKIKLLKVRSESKELKQSPSIKAALSAVRYLDKALESAADEANTHLRHALADARRPLADFLVKSGLKLPKARLPRGRRPSEA